MNAPSPFSFTPSAHVRPLAALVATVVAKGMRLEHMPELTSSDLTDLLSERSEGHEGLGPRWRSLVERFPERAIALELGQAAPLSFLGPLGELARRTVDLRGMLETFVRYGTTVSAGLRFSLHIGADEVSYCMSHVFDDAFLSPAPEAILALTLRFLRDVAGPNDGLRRVDFRHEQMGPMARYVEFFGCEVRFGQPRAALVFRPDVLDRRLPSVVAQPEHQGAERLGEGARSEGGESGERSVAGPAEPSEPRGGSPAELRIVGPAEPRIAVPTEPCVAVPNEPHAVVTEPWVAVPTELPAALVRLQESIELNAAKGEYGAEALAQRLGMSLRSVERMTSQHGMTVRRLIDRTRERHARELLDEPGTMEEIASRLDYSAASAFRRAFKRWTGLTPQAYRQGRAKERMAAAAE